MPSPASSVTLYVDLGAETARIWVFVVRLAGTGAKNAWAAKGRNTARTANFIEGIVIVSWNESKKAKTTAASTWDLAALNSHLTMTSRNSSSSVGSENTAPSLLSGPALPKAKEIRRLFRSTEKVDSLYHTFAFMVTHPFYLEEAASMLKLEKPGWLGVPNSSSQNKTMSTSTIISNPSQNKTMSTTTIISNLTSVIIFSLNIMLICQIIGLYAFISALSTPECETDADCPRTTFCDESVVASFLAGSSRACMSCNFRADDVNEATGVEKFWDFIVEHDINLGNQSKILPANCADYSFYRNSMGNRWVHHAAAASFDTFFNASSQHDFDRLNRPRQRHCRHVFSQGGGRDNAY